MSCILCGSEQRLDRMSGFDICYRCGLGALERGFEKHGLTEEVKTWTTRSGGDNPKTTHHLEVRIDLPEPVDARAHFRPEGSLDRFWKWVGATKEHQGGDPLFDDAVFVEESEGTELEAVLTDEGVQSALLELVATGGVRMGDGWVRGRRAGIQRAPMPAELRVRLALLAVHLAHWRAVHPVGSE